MARSMFLILGILISMFSISQGQFKTPKLTDYLPQNLKYNPEIPTPKDVLGFEIGDYHVSHDQMVRYLEKVATSSNRIEIKEYARSSEMRPLQVLIITSAKNHSQLEEIRTEHLKVSQEEKPRKPDPQKTPLVVYQGFSVHGNEASAGNAAILLAYILASGEGEWIDRLLENTVILLDPCLNPDGYNRFTSWVNQHRSQYPSSDPAIREHHEVWPGGRTNHYWFDLNRDWLPLVHPESQGRIKLFHDWKPNLLTDHHEMGAHSTFFFQPGVPSRVNPNTPPENQALTGKIGEFHAAALDKNSVPYFTREKYDDFYYGKGSTYPDVNGCIGILFEQASARGHIQESENGLLTFPFAVNNQLTTAISTLTAAVELRKELLEYQHDFFISAKKDAKKDPDKAIVFSCKDDFWRLHQFNNLLHQHDIRVYHLTKAIKTEGKNFKPDEAFLVPLQQNQYRFIKSLFEVRTKFEDSLFYDVSAYNLAMAYNLEFSSLDKGFSDKEWLEKQWTPADFPKGKVLNSNAPVAYLIPWASTGASALAYQLLKRGIKLKVATDKISIATESGQKTFAQGTLVLNVKGQTSSPDKIRELLEEHSLPWGLNVQGVSSGLAVSGLDMGSPSLRPVKFPRVLLVVGQGVKPYGAGEVWHLLDKKFHMDPSLVEMTELESVKLGRYSVIVMTHGKFSEISSKGRKYLGKWIESGGTLVCIRKAIKWAEKYDLANLGFYSRPEAKGSEGQKKASYGQMARDRGAQIVGGAICQVKMDLSHPLCYGYSKEELPVFRRDTFLIRPSRNPYATPVIYKENPLLAGYMSHQNQTYLASSAAVLVSGQGKGKVIAMADNPTFRGFWHGSQKMFMNAIFFGDVIKEESTEKKKPHKSRRKKPKETDN